MINQRFFSALYEHSTKLNSAVHTGGMGKSPIIANDTYINAEKREVPTPQLPVNESLKRAKDILFKTQEEYQQSYMELISDVKSLRDSASSVKDTYKPGLTSAKGKPEKLRNLSEQASAFDDSVRSQAVLFYVDPKVRESARGSLSSINALVQDNDIKIKGKLMGKEEESSAYKELNPLVERVSVRVDDVIQKRAKFNLAVLVVKTGIGLENVEAATQDALAKVNAGVTKTQLQDILYSEATTDNVVSMKTAHFPKSGIDLNGSVDSGTKVQLQTYLIDRQKLLAPVVDAISDLKMKLLEQIERMPLHAVEGPFEDKIKEIANKLEKLSAEASNASNDELAERKEPMLQEIKKLEVELGMVQELAIKKHPAPANEQQAGPSSAKMK